MSAFAALNGLSSGPGVFDDVEAVAEVPGIEEEDKEDQDEQDEQDEVLAYEQFSDEEGTPYIAQAAENEVIKTRESPRTPYSQPSALPTKSKFMPDDDNLVICEDHIIVGLKVREFILINGQCKVTIQRGAVKINNIYYYVASPDKPITIISSQSQSLPTISSTQVLDRSVGIKDDVNKENSHLFTSTYKSIVKIENLYTGLENIFLYHPPLKRFFHNRTIVNDEVLTDYERLFKTYSFEIVLRDLFSTGLYLDKSWINSINSITEKAVSEHNSKVIMVIGNKNSGKSTFAKALLNNMILLSNNETKVSYLELDPGQSEYSIPYSLSLTCHDKPTIGINISNDIDNNECLRHYYGFTTPQGNPDQYIRIIEALITEYNNSHRPKGYPLVINTPGWIKGLGKEILCTLSKFIEPTCMVLMSSNQDPESPDNIDILSGLTYEALELVQGTFQTSRYSPAQIRLFNKAAYFHTRSLMCYDFQSTLSAFSPLKISYETENSGEGFQGINLTSIINLEEDEIDLLDLPLMLEATVMGIYLIEHEQFELIKNKRKCHSGNSNIPFYLSAKDYDDLLNFLSPDFVYLGLCMVHSVNVEEEYMNIYIPPHNQERIRDLVSSHGFKMLLVRGEGEIPNPEYFDRRILSQREEEMRVLKKAKKDGKKNVQISSIPYVTFEAVSKLGGSSKPRKNVLRRGHLR